MKRIVIAGSRSFSDYEKAKVFIRGCMENVVEENSVIILSGCCRGSDELGEIYAKEHGITVEHYPAEWKKYGKRAGVVRNRKMAQAADLVICFWDGKSKGTKHMIECAKRLNKTVKIIMIT